MCDLTFIGIDVSSQTLEIASNREHATWQVTNDSDGIEQLAKQLAMLKPELIVLEATGGYEFEAPARFKPRG